MFDAGRIRALDWRDAPDGAGGALVGCSTGGTLATEALTCEELDSATGGIATRGIPVSEAAAVLGEVVEADCGGGVLLVSRFANV